MDVAAPKPGKFLAGKKIIVVGGGMAGLSFVLALRKNWPVTTSDSFPFPDIMIYERDTKVTSIGREGYSISIRSDGLSGGMQVLHKLGILEPMLRASFTGTSNSGGFSVWDVQWRSIFLIRGMSTNKELPAPSMRIARDSLRQILVDAILEKDKIHWSTPCTGVTKLVNGKLQVYLGNGQSDECDLLIVADGASSKIRAALRPEDKLSFAGAVCISGTSRFPLSKIPEPVNRFWGSVLGGRGNGLFVSPIDQNSALWSLSYLAKHPRERLKQPLRQQKVNELLQEALNRGKSFLEPFETMVRATDPSTLMVFNAMDKQPFTHVLGRDGPVVYIGDSNHAMSPFAGNGANMALMDGWDLAEQLCKADLSAALAAYDKLSIPRSKSAIQMSHWSISVAHAQGWKLWFYSLLFKLMNVIMRIKGSSEN